MAARRLAMRLTTGRWEPCSEQNQRSLCAAMCRRSSCLPGALARPARVRSAAPVGAV